VKVGVYNSHLRTLGGGEQHALAIVRWLVEQGHAVDVLARPGISLEACEQRLGIRLAGACLVGLVDDPIQAEYEATDRSVGYDLWVNATYASGARSRAARSILLVYFPIPPAPLPCQAPGVVADWVATARSRALGWIENDHGLYPAEDGGAWSDGRASYVLRLSKPGTASVRVTLGSARPPGVTEAAAILSLDGNVLAEYRLPREGTITIEVPLPAHATRGHRHRLDVRTDRFNLAELGLGEDRRDLGAFIQRVELDCGNWPQDLVEYGWGLRFLDTYDLVLANSRYTAGWVRHLWGQPARVLYPPVSPPPRSAARTNSIVGLGRFFEGSHSKKQLELVRAFARLCDDGLDGWTLHLLGGVGADGEAYLGRVREAASGYPVQISANASRGEVEDALAHAALFWQATGWGEDPTTHPERFEHFGIALVEAMGAGAVPVIIDGGAGSEVVRHRRHGLLWPADDGPGPATLELIHAPRRRSVMARRSRRRAADFSPAAFDRRMADLARLL
jgi:glycosyltransferase involved in cell wall biosynthesis